MAQVDNQSKQNNILASSDIDERYILTGDSNFQCKQCNKIVKTRGGMISHTTFHVDIKRCRYCPLKFVGRTALYRHEQQHQHKGQRPYQCQICSKRFSVKRVLRLHLTTHSKIKAFECKICHRKFSQLSSLRRHEKRHAVQSQTLNNLNNTSN